MSNINLKLVQGIVDSIVSWDVAHEELCQLTTINKNGDGVNLEYILLDIMDDDIWETLKDYLNKTFNGHLIYKIDKIENLRVIKKIIE